MEVEKPSRDMQESSNSIEKNIQASTPLWSFGVLISSSWKYYTVLLPRVIILLLIPLIFSVVNAAISIAGAPLPMSGFTELLSILVSSFFTGFMIPVVSMVILDKLYKKEIVPPPDQFFKIAFPLLVPYGLTLLLSGLVTLGGFVLFIVPGVIVNIWLSLLMYVVVLERRRGYDALLRSAGLVAGSSWEAFLRIVGVVAIILFLYTVLVGIPSFLFLFSTLGSGFDSPFGGTYSQGELPPQVKLLSQLLSVWQNMLDLFIIPFMISFFYLLYRNLYELKGDVVAHAKKTFFYLLTALGGAGIILFFLFFALLIAFLGKNLGTF